MDYMESPVISNLPEPPGQPIPGGEITMQEENTALEAQNKRLQSLVCELLLTNQKLRIELHQLRQKESSTQATHPPRYDDGRSGVRLLYEQLMKALPDLEIDPGVDTRSEFR